ncbi:fibrillin-1 [Manduca sexta]|uniref:fibrillin-1 n=1 Tax=Manduca sexta TaxID=7130 RepID=UPI00188FB390|nr:fibrillin-1 [Manduca sexta]
MKYIVIKTVLFAFYASCVNGLYSEETAYISDTCCAHAQSFALAASSVEACAQVTPPEDIEEDQMEACTPSLQSCCKEHFKEKEKCTAGMKFAVAKRCSAPESDIGKSCCEECSFGMLAGESQGKEGCGTPSSGEVSPSYALKKNAFHQCCLEVVEKPETTTEKKLETTTKKKEAPKEKCGKDSCEHICNDDSGVIKCECRTGFRLQSDNKTCKDINECAESTDDVCTADGTVCHNTDGAFKCVPIKKRDVGLSCPPGFKRNIINQVCDDINECQLPRPPCPKYLCENTIGGYKCAGKPGKPVTEAVPGAPTESSITTIKNDICPPGFRAGPDDECLDIDECEEHLDDCQRLSQHCINTHGYFFCQDHVSKRCAPGFKVNAATGICEDIDECEESSEVCKRTEICINLPGAYNCKSKISTLPKLFVKKTCQEGTRVRPGGTICEDIDECRENTHLCDEFQNCINTFGAHECRCKNGFELDSYTGSCVDIDECALKLDNCAAHLYCLNVLGSFTCVKRPPPTTSTTSTLPPYEYEYYDSEEDNTTGNVEPVRPVPTTTSTTRRPTTTSTTTTTTTPKPTTTSTTTTSTTTTPKPTTTSTTTKPRPYYPRYPPRRPYTPRRPEPIPPKPESTPNSEVTPPLPEYTPSRPEYRPESTPRRPEPTPTRPIQPEHRRPETTRPREYPRPSSIPRRPETPTRPDTTPTRPEVTPPRPTTTPTRPTPIPSRPDYPVENTLPSPRDPIIVEKDNDGSYSIDTDTIPKDTWNNVIGRDKPVNPPANGFNVNDIHCLNGYERDVYGNCVDVNECEDRRHICGNLEDCVNQEGGYYCECIAGFQRNDEGWCVPIPPTTTSTSTTTSTTTERTTAVTIPEWTSPPRPRDSRVYPPVKCELGYTFDSSVGKCVDIDECATNKATCSPTEDCVNVNGGFRCVCGRRCRAENEEPTYTLPSPPSPPPRQPAEVSNTNVITVGAQYGQRGPWSLRPTYSSLPDSGAIVTSCPWGYKLTPDKRCLDIDECARNVSDCGPMQRCENFFGGYSCQCPAGHRLVGQNGCDDIDECMHGNPCSYNAQCMNTVGSYKCACSEGFRSAPSNDKVCVDIDECTDTPGVCHQGCANAWGSYRCYCKRGYRLDNDNRTCVDVNECEEWGSVRLRGKLCAGECVNEPGSYRCACPGGYRLSEDGRSCIDIDECETGEASCARTFVPGYVCQNTRGSYHCHKIECPPGYRLESKHRCTRVQRSCPVGDWNCLHQPSAYSYNFITFVANIYLPTGSVDLFTMHGPLWRDAVVSFEMRMLNVQASPGVQPADLRCFDMRPSDNICVISLLCPLEGPQVAELELTMSLYQRSMFAGSAVARLIVIVSEYEF